jgi:hypothetical protein
LVQKVHGGAGAGDQQREEPGLRGQVGARSAREERARGRRGGAWSGPGQALAISAGTTTSALATALASIQDITVVTELGPGRRGVHRDRRGRPGRPSCSPAASARRPTRWSARSADATIRSLHVDVLFLGVHGMDPVAGLTDAEPGRGRDQPNLPRAREEGDRRRRPHQVADGGAVHVRVAVRGGRPWSRTTGWDADARAALAETVGELIVAPVDGPDGQTPR